MPARLHPHLLRAVAFAGCLLAGIAYAAPVSPKMLVEAARAAKLATIDPSLADEHDDRTIGAWLAALTHGKVRAIDWSGGACQLVIPENPRDAGGRGARCGRAVIHLVRPQDRSDQPEIEIYFEKPPPGRPLQAFAFRATMKVPGGNEYIRFTRDFEAVWRERFGSK